MRPIVYLLAAGQALGALVIFINDDFRSAEFWEVIAFLAMTCGLPTAVLAEYLLRRDGAGANDSLIGLLIEARKAKLRKQIEELNSK